jgi:branched-chain amino acid transport system substrate-binding protein
MHTPSSRTRRWAAVAATALLVVGLAGCGDDDDDDDGAAASPSAAEAEGAVVTIGVIAPLEDGLVDFGHDIRNGAQLAVDAANEADAIPGYTIELKALDDSSDPPTGKAAAEEMAEDDTVIGVVGTYNSGVAREVAPVLDAAGITMISPGNTDPALTKGDGAEPERQWEHYFRLVAADDVQGPFLVSQAREEGFTEAAVISESKPVSKGLADVFAADFTAAGGSVVHRQVVPDGTTDFTGALATVRALAPDVIFFGGEYQVAAALRKQAGEAGIEAPVMGGDGIKDPAYIAAGGDASEGDLASSIGRPVRESETATDFLEAYEDAGFEEEPGDFGPYAFDAANLLIEAAAEALDGTTGESAADHRDEIVAAVAEADVDGASGHVSFDELGDNQTKVLTLYRVEDGEWAAVRSEELAG